MTQPAGYTVGTPVTLDATKRAGILTQAAFLTRWAHGNQTSPVHRGKLVRLQRDVRLRPAAAREREHEPARADRDDVDAGAVRAARRRPELRRAATS